MKARLWDSVYPNSIRSFYEGKVILISGASGFLGGSLVKALSQIPCSIIRLTRELAKLDPTFDSSTTFSKLVDIKGDYGTQETWNNVMGDVDIVFHLAAQTSFYTSEENQSLDYVSNVLPMIRLLESCSKHAHSPVVIFAASTTQCGLVKKLPITETTLDNPITNYDKHKLIAENALKAAAKKGDVFGCALRLCSIFGPGAVSSSKDRSVLNKMIEKAIDQQSISLYGDGSDLRDFLFIDDVTTAFLTAPIFKHKISGEHFIVARGASVSMRVAVNMIKKVVEDRLGTTVNIEITSPPHKLSPIELRDDVVLSDYYQRTTGWRPDIPFLDGLQISVDHHINKTTLMG
jgi:nucleoside-diphosphate-sugar epimerase